MSNWMAIGIDILLTILWGGILAYVVYCRAEMRRLNKVLGRLCDMVVDDMLDREPNKVAQLINQWTNETEQELTDS